MTLCAMANDGSGQSMATDFRHQSTVGLKMTPHFQLPPGEFEIIAVPKKIGDDGDFHLASQEAQIDMATIVESPAIATLPR